MKKLMTLAAATLLLSACSKYYVSTLESSNAKKSEERGTFKFENDTLSVTYSFNGKNAPVSIMMYNKLNEPLFIDWQKSALIKGDQAISFSGKEIKIRADIYGSSYPDIIGEGSIQRSSLNASIALPETNNFIPPKSSVTKTPLLLAERHNYRKVPNDAFEKAFIPVSNGPGVWGRTATFTPENSPLSFKSYLTFYTEKDNKRQEFFMVQDFYLSNLTKSFSNPKNFSSLNNKPGNVFYNEESTGYGKAMTGIGIGTLVAAGAVAEANKPK